MTGTDRSAAIGVRGPGRLDEPARLLIRESVVSDGTQQRMESRPVPDPTALTTQQLLGAIAALHELLDAKVNGIEKLVNEKIHCLRELHDEKFASVQHQFSERQVMISAEIQAAKESVAKSEAGTIKQIDQQGSLIDSTSSALTDKIEDIKSRLNTSEGKGTGMAMSWAIAVAVFGMAIGAIGVVTAIITR